MVGIRTCVGLVFHFKLFLDLDRQGNSMYDSMNELNCIFFVCCYYNHQQEKNEEAKTCTYTHNVSKKKKLQSI